MDTSCIFFKIQPIRLKPSKILAGVPEFRGDPEHDAWKAGVMSGAIQLAEIDTDAFSDRYGKLAVDVAKPAVAAAG
jgi:hypothetical protein